MPLLVMHGGMPAVAVANKTPVSKSFAQSTTKEDKQDLILKKLTAIEMELGITPPQEVQLSEDEIMRRQIFAEKMQRARIAKREETARALVAADTKRKEFVKRMQKGKKKAAKKRSE